MPYEPVVVGRTQLVGCRRLSEELVECDGKTYFMRPDDVVLKPVSGEALKLLQSSGSPNYYPNFGFGKWVGVGENSRFVYHSFLTGRSYSADHYGFLIPYEARNIVQKTKGPTCSLFVQTSIGEVYVEGECAVRALKSGRAVAVFDGSRTHLFADIDPNVYTAVEGDALLKIMRDGRHRTESLMLVRPNAVAVKTSLYTCSVVVGTKVAKFRCELDYSGTVWFKLDEQAVGELDSLLGLKTPDRLLDYIRKKGSALVAVVPVPPSDKLNDIVYAYELRDYYYLVSPQFLAPLSDRLMHAYFDEDEKSVAFPELGAEIRTGTGFSDIELVYSIYDGEYAVLTKDSKIRTPSLTHEHTETTHKITVNLVSAGPSTAVRHRFAGDLDEEMGVAVWRSADGEIEHHCFSDSEARNILHHCSGRKPLCKRNSSVYPVPSNIGIVDIGYGSTAILRNIYLPTLDKKVLVVELRDRAEDELRGTSLKGATALYVGEDGGVFYYSRSFAVIFLFYKSNSNQVRALMAYTKSADAVHAVVTDAGLLVCAEACTLVKPDKESYERLKALLEGVVSYMSEEDFWVEKVLEGDNRLCVWRELLDSS